MILLVLIVTAATCCVLLASAVSNISDVHSTDRNHRGRWAVLDWTPKRTRRLDAHERRWQTALMSGQDHETRWPDVVAQLNELERAIHLPIDASPPSRYDIEWIEGRLDLIDAELLARSPLPPEPTSHD